MILFEQVKTNIGGNRRREPGKRVWAAAPRLLWNWTRTQSNCKLICSYATWHPHLTIIFTVFALTNLFHSSGFSFVIEYLNCISNFIVNFQNLWRKTICSSYDRTNNYYVIVIIPDYENTYQVSKLKGFPSLANWLQSLRFHCTFENTIISLLGLIVLFNSCILTGSRTALLESHC